MEKASAVLTAFQESALLFRKFSALYDADEPDDVPPLAASFLKKLRDRRQNMKAGDMIVLPAGLKGPDANERTVLTMVLQKHASSYSLAILNPSEHVGLHYHKARARPRLAYETLVLEPLAEDRIQDEGWWSLLYVATATPSREGAKVLYDQFLPWLLGTPLWNAASKGTDWGVEVVLAHATDLDNSFVKCL